MTESVDTGRRRWLGRPLVYAAVALAAAALITMGTKTPGGASSEDVNRATTAVGEQFTRAGLFRGWAVQVTATREDGEAFVDVDAEAFDDGAVVPSSDAVDAELDGLGIAVPVRFVWRVREGESRSWIWRPLGSAVESR